MTHWLRSLFFCASAVACVASAQGLDVEVSVALRGFSSENVRDLETLAEREAQRGNPTAWNVVKLLGIADIPDLPAIVRAMTDQVKINAPAQRELSILTSVVSGRQPMLMVSDDAKDWEYAVRVQSSRGRLLKSASRAVRGDAGASAEIVAIGKRLESGALRSSISITYSTMQDFRTRDELLDPRQNDPEIAAAGFLAGSLNAKELQVRQVRLAKLREPIKLSPRDEFRNDIYAFAPFAVKTFGTKGYRLHELMGMMLLPDIAELPAVVGMAAAQLTEKQRGPLTKIAESAQALANDAKADPGVLVVEIQRRRFELAAKGAAAAKGNAAALRELNDLGARAYDQPLGRRSFELFYLYRSEGDKVQDAATRNPAYPYLRTAAAMLETGVFSVADAQQNAAEAQTFAAGNPMAPGRESLAECFVRQSTERLKWEQRYCRQSPSGKDDQGLPIYKTDCGGNVFVAQPCRR